MRDDEIGQLIQRSLDRHVDDVQPAPDLGEWVVERGRVVRRRRRNAAIGGAAASLVLVAGAALMVPRMGQQDDTVVPAGTTSASRRAIPRPTATTTTTTAPSPTDVPTSRHRSTSSSTVVAEPAPTESTGDPTATATDPATGTTTTTVPAGDTPSPTGSGEPTGPTFTTPYGPVALPDGASAKLSGLPLGGSYLALVGSTGSPNRGILLNVLPDRSYSVVTQAGSGSIRGYDTSPNGRYLAVAVQQGGEQIQVYDAGNPGRVITSYDVPAEWAGGLAGWTSEGVSIMSGSGHGPLVWSMDTGVVTVRENSGAPATTIAP
ncbi:hypothetical protein [Arsenicicoccus dermatophilus]|uniref:hypothetical protein n=1 Tax=Arsenicicoccus dermatophilus TaxID=1076331 RepID=UPI003916EC5A